MSNLTYSDQYFLEQTLKLAKKGVSWTNPNPMVGALIVKDDKILSLGYHHKIGLPHAEISALNALKENPKGSTLYVNLEPCAHFGKTPPCTRAIIQAKIKRVVFCTLDPNPEVSSRGLKILKKAGIEVSFGILEKEARILNEAFFAFYQKGRPFVAIKFAASLDGKIATYTGDSKWITNGKARLFARTLRTHYQAVLVGINTILYDNPHLGTQLRGKKDPLRIILDPALKISLASQVLRDTNILIVTTIDANKEKMKVLQKRGIQMLTFKTQSTINIGHLLSELKKQEVISVLVEGGGETIGRFVDEGFCDKVYAFYAPLLIGGENSISAVRGNGSQTIGQAFSLTNLSFKHFKDNFLVTGYCKG